MKKRVKKAGALALALFLALAAGCAATPTAPSAGPTPASAGGGPSASPEKVLLVVSFGTSYNDNREASIGGIERALREAYPDYEIRRAFTSQIIIDKLRERDGTETDNVTEAMDRLAADGVKEVVVQPTHVMSGFEYDDVVNEVAAYEDKFDSFKIGKTLLATDGDYDKVISAITEETGDYDTDGTAIVFMGHGTGHEANGAYAKLQERVFAAGYDRYFIGTVEAAPSLEDVIALVKDSGSTRVVLLPLMIVAGDHANNDMAGDEDGSWKKAFEAEGFEVTCVLQGLGQYAGIQELIVRHAGETIAER